MKREMRRKLMAVGGVMICGASVGIFQKIALGTDPFTCFVTGIANVFGSTYSTWYVILTGIMLVGVAALHRHGFFLYRSSNFYPLFVQYFGKCRNNTKSCK